LIFVGSFAEQNQSVLYVQLTDTVCFLRNQRRKIK